MTACSRQSLEESVRPQTALCPAFLAASRQAPCGILALHAPQWLHSWPCGVQGPETQHSGLDRAAALCHQDGILHMTSVDLADCILLTAGHDGVVKAWK